jgi:succinate dehydrogenase/fumarate reductase cytochrome b subunit
MAGMLIHGLNGVRVALVGMGLGVKSHKATFIVLMLIAAAVLAYAAFRVFTA